MINSPVLETQQTLKRLGGETALLQILYAAYIEDTPHRLRELQDALTQKQLDTCGQLAHQIKGSSSTIGAHMVGEQAAALEKNCKTGNLDAARLQYQALQKAFDVVAQFLATTPK